MGMYNVVFLESIEWFDPTGKEIVYRIPQEGSGEIKFGAQLTVRESQVAVLFYKGMAVHAFGSGRHTLKTGNIPLLTKLLSIPWAMTSPLRAEVYFVNTKTFTDLRWGTRDPVAFKDAQLGLIRLRAHGVLNLRVVQPLLFINRMVGTLGRLSTADIEEYLSQVIVSRLNDIMGAHLRSILDLPGTYDEWAMKLKAKLSEDMAHFGISLTQLYINAITPPPEVQRAIDDRSKVGIFDDLNKLLTLKTAMAIEEAAKNPGTTGNGIGLGLAFMMPHIMAQVLRERRGDEVLCPVVRCPDCNAVVPDEARFCPACGHQIVVFDQCPHCGKNVPPGAKFCSSCGGSLAKPPEAKTCSHCGTKNLPLSVFCNQCGERLE